MSLWTNLWSFATAAGTTAMAVTTYAIIRQGAKHHRDQFKPICVLVPPGGVDPLTKRDKLLEKIDPAQDNPSFGTLAIRCGLRNVGTGPALHVRIKFRFLDMNGWTTEAWELSPLAAGEARGGEYGPLLVPIRLNDRFNATDFAMVTGKPWEIWLEYEDVFGRRFCSVHHKRPLQMENMRRATASETRPGGPSMYMPPEPWVTFLPEKIC